MEYIMPLVQAMAELDEKSLMDAMQDALREKQKTERIENSLQEGLKQVGVRFAQGQYYLADMIVSGDLYQEAMNLLISNKQLEGRQQKSGKVLIGVMKDDIHDIGKDIVQMLLKLDGFDVGPRCRCADGGVPLRGAELSAGYHRVVRRHVLLRRPYDGGDPPSGRASEPQQLPGHCRWELCE